MPNPISSSRIVSRQGPGRAPLLALATGTGLAASLLAYFVLARQTQGAGAQPMRPVVVAACDLPARRPLTIALLRVRRMPLSEAPTDAIGMPEELAGQVTTGEIAAGEPVTRRRVTARSASPGMAWSIAPSHRAVSVALDPVSGVAGFLEPGDHVDVLATLEAGSGPEVTRTLLQNARLLAIGSRTDAATPGEEGDGKPATSATLEVTPSGAQAIAQAATHGKLQLALRGLGDGEQPPLADLTGSGPAVPPSPTPTVADVVKTNPPHTALPAGPRGGRKAKTPPRPLPAPPEPPPAALPQIKVVRGTETTTVTVGD